MNRHNSGQIRIIEAFLAVLIIFSSFTISSNLTLMQNVSRSEDLASAGLQALVKLDSDGNLGKIIDQGNWTALRKTLTIVLPSGICFNLTVYDEAMHQINDETISNGALNSEEVAFVEYLCSSQNSTFHCYIIHMYLAVAQ